MREPGLPDYEPPAPGETLREWLASSSQDWIDSQPTMWMPAVPAQPVMPAPPSIPRQRGSENSIRRGMAAAVPSGTMPLPETTPLPEAIGHRSRSGPRSRFGWPAVVGALVAAGLSVTPWVAAAAVAVLAGGWSVAVTVIRLVWPSAGVPLDRGHRALRLVTVLIAALAVGMGGWTVWAAVTSTGAPG